MRKILMLSKRYSYEATEVDRRTNCLCYIMSDTTIVPFEEEDKGWT